MNFPGKIHFCHSITFFSLRSANSLFTRINNRTNLFLFFFSQRSNCIRIKYVCLSMRQTEASRKKSRRIKFGNDGNECIFIGCVHLKEEKNENLTSAIAMKSIFSRGWLLYAKCDTNAKILFKYLSSQIYNTHTQASFGKMQLKIDQPNRREKTMKRK